jgi:hypothetical protein
MPELPNSTTCPFCSVIFPEATQFAWDQTPPGPGDVSYCSKCGEIAKFTDDMQLRRPTPDELRQIEATHGDEIAIATWVAFQESEGDGWVS